MKKNVDLEKAFLISEDEIHEALYFSPEGKFILEIESETKSEVKHLSREEARAWLSKHDPGSFEKMSFQEIVKEAQASLETSPLPC
jgi:hypothetical protein